MLESKHINRVQVGCISSLFCLWWRAGAAKRCRLVHPSCIYTADTLLDFKDVVQYWSSRSVPRSGHGRTQYSSDVSASSNIHKNNNKNSDDKTWDKNRVCIPLLNFELAWRRAPFCSSVALYWIDLGGNSTEFLVSGSPKEGRMNKSERQGHLNVLLKHWI